MQNVSSCSPVSTKVCPRCGEELFSDMDTCFGCLFSFSRAQSQQERVTFELDEPEGCRWNSMPSYQDDSPSQSAPSFRGNLAPQSDSNSRCASNSQSDSSSQNDSASRLLPSEENISLSLKTDASIDGTQSLPSRLSAQTAVMEPSLWIRGSDLDVVVPLKDGLTVGRMPTNDVVLHSCAVSRQHIRFEQEEGGAAAINLGATNPAVCGGRPIHERAHMEEGTTVQVCGTTFTLIGIKHAPSNTIVLNQKS